MYHQLIEFKIIGNIMCAIFKNVLDIIDDFKQFKYENKCWLFFITRSINYKNYLVL